MARMIQIAIARGWLEGEKHAGRRARLVDALARLALDPASPIRDKLQACRLLAVSMTAADLRILGREKVPGPCHNSAPPFFLAARVRLLQTPSPKASEPRKSVRVVMPQK